MHLALPQLATAPDKPKRPRRSTRAAQRKKQPALRTLDVLVVDDDPASAKLAKVLLAAEGCAVRTASSAEEALTMIAQRIPDLVVLDLVLPLMSGLLLAQTLRSRPATRDLVIVVVSAFNGPEMARLAHEAGCAAYLRKPIDALTFADVVLQQVRGKK
jgi:CheY-like chemotaxis protein